MQPCMSVGGAGMRARAVGPVSTDDVALMQDSTLVGVQGSQPGLNHWKWPTCLPNLQVGLPSSAASRLPRAWGTPLLQARVPKVASNPSSFG